MKNPHGLVLIEQGKPAPRNEQWDFRPEKSGWWTAYESGRFIVTSESREGLIKSVAQINLADYPAPSGDELPF